MSTVHDYTREDAPYDDQSEIDDYVIAGAAAPPKTAEQIQKENVFVEIPPGEYLLRVHSIPERPKSDFYKVNLDNRLMSYQSDSARVKFCLPDNPKATIEDYFVFPPNDDAEMKAYWQGVPPGKTAAGFAANKFYQFIGALGFPYPAGGRLSEEGRTLRNWKNRIIRVTVIAGQAYIDKKTGLEKPGRNQIKLFSYLPGGDGPIGSPSAHIASHAQPSRPQSQATQRQPVGAGAPAMPGGTVDDLDL